MGRTPLRLTFNHGSEDGFECSDGKPVKVTCEAESGGTCVKWTVEGDRACFWQAATKSGNDRTLRVRCAARFKITELVLEQ